ncbi:MAG: hypothetical protein AABZ39_12215 [Spirochaetota bacterium]
MALKQFTMNDFFNETGELVKANWMKSLIAGAVVFLPSAALYLISFRWLFGSLGAFMERIQAKSDTNEILEAFLMIAAPYALLFAAAFLFAITSYIMYAFTMRLSFDTIRKTRSSVGEVITGTLSLIPRMTGQSVIIGSLFFVGILLFYGLLLGGIFFMAARDGMHGAGIIFFILGCIVWFMAFLGFVLWLSLKSSFALPAIVYDRTLGAFESLGRSFALVRGSFWRTLGLTLLVSIILGFAVGILSGPVIFILILPGYIELIKSILAGTNDYMKTFPSLFANLAWGIGASMYIQSVAMAVVYPAFQSLLFVDLTARASKKRKAA